MKKRPRGAPSPRRSLLHLSDLEDRLPFTRVRDTSVVFPQFRNFHGYRNVVRPACQHNEIKIAGYGANDDGHLIVHFNTIADAVAAKLAIS